MGVHDGHRDRMRTRFLNEGIDGFSDIQVLELLLFYAVPRRDTNELAHELLTHFGSLSQVLEASETELEKVNGIGENAAVLLKLIPAIGRRYQADKVENVKTLSTIEKCAAYLRPRFFGRGGEVVYLLCLDAKCGVLACRSLAEGDVSSAALSVRKIVETALAVQSVSVILAHNHPGGIAFPSQEDLDTTMRAAAALEAIGIVLADHLIFSSDAYYSMTVHGYLNNKNQEV